MFEILELRKLQLYNLYQPTKIVTAMEEKVDPFNHTFPKLGNSKLFIP